MIRRAVPEDAEAIDRVHVRACEHAYSDFIPPDRMEGADPIEERVLRWHERMGHPAIRTWVWDQDGFIAGFASAGGGELRALYVEPAAQGAGVGSALLAHAEAAMRAAGSARAELWVHGQGEHGRRFFAGRGWSLVPGGDEELDRAPRRVCYRKEL